MTTSREYICAKSAREIVPNLKTLWASGATWQGICAEAYSLSSVETPEYRMFDHSLVMHLSAPARVELKADGRWETRARVPGDMAILPAAALRQVRSQQPHEVLVVTVSPEVIARTAVELGDATSIEIVPRVHQRDSQLEHICRALKAEAESNYVSGPLYGESLALAVCVHLLRQQFAGGPGIAKKGGIAPRTLRRVIDYIESNLDSPLRMASLAEIAGLSEYRFAHNFRSATGVPPYQYVIRTRLERAKQMLRQTDLSVLDIAYTVGCQSVSRFNSLFRRETGSTPSAYRACFR